MIRTTLLWLPLLVAVLAAPVHAQLGQRPAEQWSITLESGQRLEGLEITRVVEEIGLEPGQIVADIGAGTGVFTVPIAMSVGPTGTVYAVEVDEGFLPMIDEKAEQEGLENVISVLGEFTDPALPTRDIDVAFFHDVLHHIEARPEYLDIMAGYMAPGSRMIVVDYDKNVPGVPHSGQPEMLISPAEVADWMDQAGFRVTRVIEMFDDKFFVEYTRTD